MTRIAFLLVALSAGMIAAAPAQTPPATAAMPWKGAISPVTSPAGVNSAQPQMTVSRRGILLSWIERAGSRATLKFAERTGTAGRRLGLRPRVMTGS